jgi:hypothetical protein
VSAARGTIPSMPVVLLLGVVVILAGVVVVAVGHGGELAMFRPDAPPIPQRLGTAAEMAAFRPPPAFLGYSATATDDALRRIAFVVAKRDAELATLRGQLAALRGEPLDAPRPAEAGERQRSAASWQADEPWQPDEYGEHPEAGQGPDAGEPRQDGAGR